MDLTAAQLSKLDSLMHTGLNYREAIALATSGGEGGGGGGVVSQLAMLNADNVAVTVTVDSTNTLVVTPVDLSHPVYTASADAGKLALGAGPSGQAFTLSAPANISAVVLYFDTAPGIDSLSIGLSDGDVAPNLATKTVATDASTPAGAFRINLDAPVPLLANTQYYATAARSAGTASARLQGAAIGGVTFTGAGTGHNYFVYGGAHGTSTPNELYSLMLGLLGV